MYICIYIYISNRKRERERERERVTDRAGGVAKDGDIVVVDPHHGIKVGDRLPERNLLPKCIPPLRNTLLDLGRCRPSASEWRRQRMLIWPSI